MFLIHCPVCDRPQLVGTRSITSLRNTPEGPVATVRCPLADHHCEHHFAVPSRPVPARRSVTAA